MSVYTPLSLEQVQAFASPYGLEVMDLIPIQGGIEKHQLFFSDAGSSTIRVDGV